jgi:hypothetical protein
MHVSGDFTISWSGMDANESFDIFARSFDSSGVALEPVFSVSPTSSQYQAAPTLASGANDRILIVWERQSSLVRKRTANTNLPSFGPLGLALLAAATGVVGVRSLRAGGSGAFGRNSPRKGRRGTVGDV